MRTLIQKRAESLILRVAYLRPQQFEFTPLERDAVEESDEC